MFQSNVFPAGRGVTLRADHETRCERFARALGARALETEWNSGQELVQSPDGRKLSYPMTVRVQRSDGVWLRFVVPVRWRRIQRRNRGWARLWRGRFEYEYDLDPQIEYTYRMIGRCLRPGREVAA